MENERLKIETSHGDQVTHLILNSPQNLNAMDLEMAASFRQATFQLQSRSLPRAIVIRGEGRAFSAGGDLEMLRLKAGNPLEQNRLEMLEFYGSFLGLRDLNVPLLCALHGHVVGAGLCFAAACDLRIADDTCLLAAPFTRLALHPGMGGSYFLPRAFGPEVARDLMLTGRRMTADEACQKGFLSQVVSPNHLHMAVDETLDKILLSAPYATLRLIMSERASESETVNSTLEREAKEQALCYAQSEFLLGVQALQDKQRPPWC